MIVYVKESLMTERVLASPIDAGRVATSIMVRLKIIHFLFNVEPMSVLNTLYYKKKYVSFV